MSESRLKRLSRRWWQRAKRDTFRDYLRSQLTAEYHRRLDAETDPLIYGDGTGEPRGIDNVHQPWRPDGDCGCAWTLVQGLVWRYQCTEHETEEQRP